MRWTSSRSAFGHLGQVLALEEDCPGGRLVERASRLITGVRWSPAAAQDGEAAGQEVHVDVLRAWVVTFPLWNTRLASMARIYEVSIGSILPQLQRLCDLTLDEHAEDGEAHDEHDGDDYTSGSRSRRR